MAASARVLLIEHQASHVGEISRLLRDAGYAVLVAEDGDDGVRVARRERPDLILCALAPPANGLATLVTLRTDAAFDDTMIVAVTFFSSPEDRRHILSVGFDGVIEKPVAEATFAAAVGGFLQTRRPRRDGGGAF